MTNKPNVTRRTALAATAAAVPATALGAAGPADPVIPVIAEWRACVTERDALTEQCREIELAEGSEAEGRFWDDHVEPADIRVSDVEARLATMRATSPEGPVRVVEVLAEFYLHGVDLEAIEDRPDEAYLGHRLFAAVLRSAEAV
ncbi:MAG: hypothetical protein AAGD08_03080 [Pseudomonadota bacterium]